MSSDNQNHMHHHMSLRIFRAVLLVFPAQCKVGTTGLVPNMVFQGMGDGVCRGNLGFASPHGLYEIESPAGQYPRIAL